MFVLVWPHYIYIYINQLEKYESKWEGIPYIVENMFETTNQDMYTQIYIINHKIYIVIN